MATEYRDWNNKVIEEFRANAGKLSGQFEGAPMLLLPTTGAKSGKQFTTPVMYLPNGDHVVVFASKGGAPTNPDWYHNLKKHPTVTVEIGTDRYNAQASEVTGEERDKLYARQAHAYPGFGEYQANTTRVIPVIALRQASQAV